MKSYRDIPKPTKTDNVTSYPEGWDAACLEYPGHWFVYLPTYTGSWQDMRGPFATKEEAQQTKDCHHIVWICSGDDPRMKEVGNFLTRRKY